MANFPSAGEGFSRGFARGRVIKQNRLARKRQEKQASRKAQIAASERLRKKVSAAREQSLAGFRRFVETAAKAAAAGEAPDSEVIRQARVGAIAALGSFASLAQDLKKRAIESGADEQLLNSMPDGAAFVKQNIPLFDLAVQAGAQESDEGQIRTLTPDEVQELSPDLPPGTVIQEKPSGELLVKFEPGDDEDMSALQEKVAALIATGIDEKKALGIAAGRFAVSLDPITRERQVIDIATGEQVGGPDEPAPPEGEVPSLVPPDIEAPAATGGPGALKNFVNILGGAFNAGPAFPEAQEATEALTTVKELTSITLQEPVPGRPSNLLLEKLDKLTVTPNSIFQGEERARSRFEQTKRMIDGEIARMKQDVLPRELPPDMRVNIEVNLTQLERLSEAYGDLLESFDEKESDFAPEVQSLLDKYAPQGQQD